MPKLEYLKKLNWSIVGVILAVGFGLFGIYSYFHKEKPKVVFEITNESDVFNINKPLKELVISFQNENIQEKNLNLRILTIKIQNTGEIDILQNYYDNSLKWGLEVKNGKIIEARLVNSNSGYLNSENLQPRIDEDVFINLQKVIFEKDKYFILELLVLHSKEHTPTIIPKGKIAGIENISLLESWKNQGKMRFLDELFAGSFSIQISRFIFYTLLTFAIIAIIGLIVETTDKRKTARYAAKRKQFKERLIADNIDNPLGQSLLNFYNKYGIDYIKQLLKIISNQEKLINIIETFKLIENNKELYKYIKDNIAESPNVALIFFIGDLLNQKAIIFDNDNKPNATQELASALKKLLESIRNFIASS